MKQKPYLKKLGKAALAGLLFLAGCGDEKNQQALENQRCTLGISNVTVVPMTSETTLENKSVLIEGKKIVKIIDGNDPAVQGCKNIIKTEGKFLAPGLNDLHTHIETESFPIAFGMEPAPVDFEKAFAPYLANGITGLRIMSGAPDILDYRAKKVPATPLLVVSTPMLSGEPPILPEPLTKIITQPDKVGGLLKGFVDQGYDFVKIRRNLDPAVFRAVIQAAKNLGLDVDGHLSRNPELTVFDILSSGQKGIAHLDELAALIKKEDYPELARLLKECGCYVSSTLNVSKNIARQITDYDAMVARPETRFVYPLIANAFWLKPANPYLSSQAPADYFMQLNQDSKDLLKFLNAQGVAILAGSDALNPMLIPGFSLIEELQALVEAGLTPYQALKTATLNPSLAVPGFEGVGTIEEGKTANLVLLNNNPLLNVSAYGSPEAVIMDGILITSEELEKKLEEF